MWCRRGWGGWWWLVAAGAGDVEGGGARPVEVEGGCRGGVERGEVAEVDAVPVVLEHEMGGGAVVVSRG